VSIRIASFSPETLYDQGRRRQRNSEAVMRFRRLYRQLQEAVAKEEFIEAARIKEELESLRETL